MSAGRYTHRLTVQVFEGTDDGNGGQVEAGHWTTLGDVWGSVTPAGATAKMAAGLLQTELTHRIGCWYRAGLLCEHRSLRMVDAATGLTYALRAVRDADGRRIRLDCDAVQVHEPIA